MTPAVKICNRNECIQRREEGQAQKLSDFNTLQTGVHVSVCFFFFFPCSEHEVPGGILTIASKTKHTLYFITCSQHVPSWATNYSSRKGLLQPNNFPRSVHSFFAHLCLPLPRETRRQEGCSWKQVKHNKAFRKCGCLENRWLGEQLHSAVYWLQKISCTQPRKLPWLPILRLAWPITRAGIKTKPWGDLIMQLFKEHQVLYSKEKR